MSVLRGLRRLNRYEARLFRIARKAGKLAQIEQLGYSARSSDGFRFPIYSLTIGKPAALERSPVGLVAGVHGLETIGIRVLLDFLESIFDEPNRDVSQALLDGDIGIVSIPILNPGGVALKSRANPAGVDLMRNSGKDGDTALPFFGGHRMSSKLPYFRGKSLQPESRALFRFCLERFSQARKGTILPVLDVHSGFGMKDSVWWPYAGKKTPSADHYLFERLSRILHTEGDGITYEPQTQAYTVHGDLWDRLYDDYRRSKKPAKLLPFTLEIGTWSDVKRNPGRLLSKRGLFNPPPEQKALMIQRYRPFLSKFVLLSLLYGE